MLKEDLLALVEEKSIKLLDSIIDKINDLVFRWKEYAKTACVGAALTDSIDQTLLHLE